MSTLMKRAAGDTTTVDVPAWLLGLPEAPRLPAVWPLVQSLARAGLLVTTLGVDGTTSPALPTPSPPVPVTDEQDLQKGVIAFRTLTAGLTNTDWHTFAVGTDVSIQLDALGPSTNQRVLAVLEAAVALGVDQWLATQLAEGVAPVADVDAALAAVAGWAGPRLVVTNAAAGMSDLQAFADASEGAVSVVVDPFITQRFVIAADGISLTLLGPDRLTALRPPELGRDVAVGAYVIGPVVGANAVAVF